MSKVYNYILISVGLVFLLKFAGLPTGADQLLNWIGYTNDASGISSGTFFLAIFTLFAAGAGTGIAISYFTKSPSETWVIAPIASGIFTIISTTFIAIVNYSQNFGFIYYIVWMIFIPLLVAFAIAIIQFWRGSD